MMQIQCPACDSFNTTDAELCRGCGALFELPVKKEKDDQQFFFYLCVLIYGILWYAHYLGKI